MDNHVMRMAHLNVMNNIDAFTVIYNHYFGIIWYGVISFSPATRFYNVLDGLEGRI